MSHARPDRTRRLRRLALRALLGAALGAALFVSVGHILSRTAHARTQAALLDLGERVLAGATAEPSARPSVVMLNGAELEVKSGVTEEPLSELMERSAEACSGDPLEGGDTERAFSACSGQDESGFGDRVAEDALAWLAGGDIELSASVDFLYAEQRDGESHWVRIRSSEPIRLDRLFSRDGDAPGSGTTEPPRPETSRRILTMRRLGAQTGLSVYLDRDRTMDQLADYYREQLPRAGWRVVADWRRPEGRIPRRASVAVERDAETALLVLAEEPRGTTTTFLILGGRR